MKSFLEREEPDAPSVSLVKGAVFKDSCDVFFVAVVFGGIRIFQKAKGIEDPLLLQGFLPKSVAFWGQP